MERLIRKVGENIGGGIIQKIHMSLIHDILIAVIIQYVIYLILQVVDFFLELVLFNVETYIFYYLKYLFFGFSFIVQGVVLISIIVCFSFLNKMEGNDAVQNRVFSTFVKILTAIYTFWSIALIGTSIPRIVILVVEREKISNYIAALVYCKVFIMISIYLNLLVMYILDKESNPKHK